MTKRLQNALEHPCSIRNSKHMQVSYCEFVILCIYHNHYHLAQWNLKRDKDIHRTWTIRMYKPHGNERGPPSCKYTYNSWVLSAWNTRIHPRISLVHFRLNHQQSWITGSQGTYHSKPEQYVRQKARNIQSCFPKCRLHVQMSYFREHKSKR